MIPVPRVASDLSARQDQAGARPADLAKSGFLGPAELWPTREICPHARLIAISFHRNSDRRLAARKSAHEERHQHLLDVAQRGVLLLVSEVSAAEWSAAPHE